MSLKILLKCPISSGNKPLSEPMTAQFIGAYMRNSASTFCIINMYHSFDELSNVACSYILSDASFLNWHRCHLQIHNWSNQFPSGMSCILMWLSVSWHEPLQLNFLAHSQRTWYRPSAIRLGRNIYASSIFAIFWVTFRRVPTKLGWRPWLKITVIRCIDCDTYKGRDYIVIGCLKENTYIYSYPIIISPSREMKSSVAWPISVTWLNRDSPPIARYPIRKIWIELYQVALLNYL